MKIIYHFILAMIYLRIAGLYRKQNDGKWLYWMIKSSKESKKISSSN